MYTKKARITEKALELLKAAPNGLKRSELVNQLHGAHPDDTLGTIRGVIWNLDSRMPEMVCKPSKALFCLVKYRDGIVAS